MQTTSQFDDTPSHQPSSPVPLSGWSLTPETKVTCAFGSQTSVRWMLDASIAKSSWFGGQRQNVSNDKVGGVVICSVPDVLRRTTRTDRSRTAARLAFTLQKTDVSKLIHLEFPFLLSVTDLAVDRRVASVRIT